MHRVIPLCRRVFLVADELDFSSPRWLNTDFARITGNKTIAKTRLSAGTFADLEKVEKCSRTLIVGQSQWYWLLSALLSQLKQDGFQPSDLSLFDKNISALSASFATQTSVCSGLTNFIMAKRRKSFPVSKPQKRELFGVSWLRFLFD